MPIRLCYMGNTFLNNSSYQGRLKESTQLGAELLGDSTVDADAEIIAMVIENRQNLLPPLYHTAFSVQKMPACEQ